MIIDQVKELVGVGKITEANELLGYKYQTKGRLIRAQIQGLSIVIPTDSMEAIPCGGNYIGLVEIAGQENVTKIVVNESQEQTSSAVIFVDLRDFNELPHVSSLPVSIRWIEQE